MPHETIGPSLRRTLVRVAGPDPFAQQAVLRLYQVDTAQPPVVGGLILQADVRDQITRAIKVDAVDVVEPR